MGCSKFSDCPPAKNPLIVEFSLEVFFAQTLFPWAIFFWGWWGGLH